MYTSVSARASMETFAKGMEQHMLLIRELRELVGALRKRVYKIKQVDLNEFVTQI